MSITPTPSPPPRPRVAFDLLGWNPRPAWLAEPGWATRVFVNNMAPSWRGIRCDGSVRDYLGVSCFLMPEPSPGATASAHFDPRSPYFQAFVGVYVLPPVEGVRAPIGVCVALGERDDLAWSRLFGDPEPRCRVEVVEPLTCVERDEDGSPRAWRCRIDHHTRANLGPGNRREGLPPLLRPPLDEGPDRWGGIIAGYQDITQICHGRLWYQGDYLIVSYFVGAAFVDRAGRRVDTLADHPGLREQMSRMADGVRIVDTGAAFTCPPPSDLHAR